MLPFFLVHFYLSYLSDIEKIRSGIGDKAALFLQYFSTFIIGFVIAFALNWKLALVLSNMFPLLSFLGATVSRVRISRMFCNCTVLYNKVRLIRRKILNARLT